MSGPQGATEAVAALFAHLHLHPERSWQEWQTTQTLTERMTALGWRVRTFDGMPGLIAESGPEEGPVVALRTDLDALWQEVDGHWRANHSCGHDGHMAAVYGAACLLTEGPAQGVRTRILFQPAEEVGEGALRLVEAGALEDVVYLFGLHLRPIAELPPGKMSAAIHHGAALQLDGTIHGQAAHAARPHQGRNPIETAAAIVQAAGLYHGDPMVPQSVKMTGLHAGGESTNVIPQTAQFSLDLRAATNQAMDALVESLGERIDGVAQAYGTPIEWTTRGRVVAATVSEKARAFMAQAIVSTLGEEALAPDVWTPGGEDFHFYTDRLPHLQATMLGVGCGLTPGLHDPHMRFDQSALPLAARILAEVVRKAGRDLNSMRE